VAPIFGLGLDSYGAWGKRAEEFVVMLAELAPLAVGERVYGPGADAAQC
jgi:hypothetical protein